MSSSRGRLARDTNACQFGRQVHTPLASPWRNSRHEQAKTRLYRYVKRESDGVPLAKVVRDVWQLSESGSQEYHRVRRLAERFYNRYPGLFKTQRRDGLLWIEPRVGVFNLRQQYAKRKTSGQQPDGLSDVSKHGTNSESSQSDSPTYPKDRVNAVLDDYLQFQSDNVKQSFFREFVQELDAIDGKYNLFERVRGSGEDYLCVPYNNRFNSAGRAGDIQEGFNFALETAGQRHSSATVLTVTTDPKRHSGLSDAIQGLSDNKARLMSWLSTDYQLGYRPQNLTVLEFSESGLPHYHIVLFGVSWAVSQAQLSTKWAEYGQGSVVDIRTAETTHDSTTWLLHDDSKGTVSLSQYLGKAIKNLQTVAQSDVSELDARVECGDTTLWRQVLYWATERQYYTCSPSLKRSTAGDDLPHVSVWEFVGSAQYEDIPAHVRRNAVFADRPPPEGAATESAAAVG